MTAREAADRLGVKLDTLYAYVSRGRLRSVSVAGTRQRRYALAEVEALRDTAAAPPRGAEGEPLAPIIASAICLIENGRLYYRGEDALALAASASLEEVARLLWQDSGPPADAALEPAGPRKATPHVAAGGVAVGLIERCQMRLATLAVSDLPALDLTRAGVVRTGWHILHALAGCIAPISPTGEPLHQRIAAAWGLDGAGADLLRRCLVLLADHELNASTFVARCVASTGATPYAVIAAALAALSGRLHGGASARAEALFRELPRVGDPLPLMAARLARGEDLPGFGHFLYPDGDPRAAAILAALRNAAPGASEMAEAAVAAGTRLTGRLPNVDFALAAATTALRLPPDAALGLFVVGRTLGWVAHAIEQYESGVLIRPRARYTGTRP